MTNPKIRRLGRAESRRMYEMLSKLAKTKGEACSSRFKFLGIEDLMERSRSRGRIGARAVAEAAAAVFARHVKDPNLFFQQEDDAFAIVFINTSAERASKISEDCRDQIIALLEEHHASSELNLEMEVSRLTKEYLEEHARDLFPDIEETELLEFDLAAPAPAPKREAVKAEVCFQPVWRASKCVTGIYVATLRKQEPGLAPRYGYSCLSDPTDIRQLANAERALMVSSLNGLLAAERNNEKFAVVAPISYSAFADRKHGDAYRDVLHQVAPRLRPNLYLQLVGLESRFISEQVIYNINYLADQCRHLLVHLPLTADGFSALANTRLSAVGATIFTEKDRGAALRNRLSYFAAAMRRFDVPLFVSGIRDLADAHAAIGSGFEYLSGPFIGKPQKQPSSIEFKSLADLNQVEAPGHQKRMVNA